MNFNLITCLTLDVSDLTCSFYPGWSVCETLISYDIGVSPIDVQPIDATSSA